MFATFVCDQIDKKHIIDDNVAKSIVGGVLFFISEHFHLKITKKHIHDRCGISEVTIKKCFNKINAIKDILLPSSLLSKYGVSGVIETKQQKKRLSL